MYIWTYGQVLGIRVGVAHNKDSNISGVYIGSSLSMEILNETFHDLRLSVWG